MKPFVVYINENTNEIALTKKEFEQFLKEAYDQGYNDGYSKGISNCHSNWWSNPSITYYGNQGINRTITTPSYDPSNTQITCESDHACSASNTAVNSACEAHNTIGD